MSVKLNVVNLSIIIIFILTLVGGCELPVYHITGTVLDEDTRQSIPGAVVEIERVVMVPDMEQIMVPTHLPVTSVFTDEAGKFTVTRTEYNDYRLSIFKDGYHPVINLRYHREAPITITLKAILQ